VQASHATPDWHLNQALVAEQVFCLVFQRILEFDPDVHAARTTKGWIKLFEMIRGAKVVMNQHHRIASYSEEDIHKKDAVLAVEDIE
jgi:hypothetical protein